MTGLGVDKNMGLRTIQNRPYYESLVHRKLTRRNVPSTVMEPSSTQHHYCASKKENEEDAYYAAASHTRNRRGSPASSYLCKEKDLETDR
ncbi:hypothetical protein AVEN_105725-1 [Araneus ventricosus]|uniref:Uncharacterized protein n=1 Tax=Araneus ventricosus TaxID=182803 RepID=A0A4Y2IDT9_ARAVE|nr:hypothetical protein AVEN_105725-1 [Araneus ventricosus]